MQVESPDKIRNLAVVGHSDTGKTTLVSSLLYAGGATQRRTKVDDGNTVTDFDPQEIDRRISIGLAACHVPWKGHKINLLDCPGYGIFFHETQSGMRAADAALLAVNAVSGVEVSTEKVWSEAEELGLPVFFHLTKMDRERADFDGAVAALQERFAREALPIQLPIGSESSFVGVVDLVTRKAYRFEADGSGRAEPTDIPEEMADRVEEARGQLMEAVAESNLELLERFFELGELPQDELERGLRLATRKRVLFPVTCGSDLHGIGPSALLDALVAVAPKPTERAFVGTEGGSEKGDGLVRIEGDPDGAPVALVVKTMSDPFSGKISVLRVAAGTFESDSMAWNSREGDNVKIGQLLALQGKSSSGIDRLVTGDIGGVAKLKETSTGDTLCEKGRSLTLDWMPPHEPAMAFAVEPRSKGDEEKIGEALHRLMEEDPTLHVSRDPDTHEYLLSGTGQLHIEIAVAKLKERYKVDVVLHPPKVPYRETIKRQADGHGRHKKQSGGRGQFADCKIKLEPLPQDSETDFEFADEIFGGSIPQGYRPAVEKGIQEARRRGYLAGYPVVNFKVRLLDGQYHDVDSSEMAFKIAGSLAFKDAMARAGATLLEPVMKVDIVVPDDHMGDVMSDLSQRRGRVQGMDVGHGSDQIVHALAPMAEMLNYAPSLRSLTQGRASFHMEFAHYEEVPKNIRDKIVAEAAGGTGDD